jgi:hypothetical protein
MEVSRIVLQFPTGPRASTLLQSVQKFFGTHPASWTKVNMRGGIFPLRQICLSLRLTTQFHLEPRLRMSGDKPSLPWLPSWCAHGKFYFLFHKPIIQTKEENKIPIKRHSLFDSYAV